MLLTGCNRRALEQEMLAREQMERAQAELAKAQAELDDLKAQLELELEAQAEEQAKADAANAARAEVSEEFPTDSTDESQPSEGQDDQGELSEEKTTAMKIDDAINDVCPRSGKPISADSLAEYRGYVVGFCNTHCRDDFAANIEERPDDRAAFDAIIAKDNNEV